MFIILLQGLGLGFTAGVQPGPFQTYLISQALDNGWRRTLVAAFAPLLSDGPIAALVLLVLSQVPPWFQRGLYLAGGLFILFLAWNAFRQWKASSRATLPSNPAPTHSLFRAALMNVFNPAPYVFWSLVNGPLVLRAWAQSPLNAFVYILAFYGTMIAVNIAFVMAAGSAGQVNPQVRHTLIGLSAGALALFGLYQLWRGIGGF